VLINAAGGKSIITTLQRIGRGLRKKKDNRLLVLDFFDQTNSYLRNHAQQRIDVCRGEKFNVKVRAKPFDLSTFFSTLDNE
jgi:superfamily II DNA or RNA helicase